MKTRIKTRMFMDGQIISAKLVVECLHGRRWLPIGDENGICKFDSREQAEPTAKELSEITENS